MSELTLHHESLHGDALPQPRVYPRYDLDAEEFDRVTGYLLTEAAMLVSIPENGIVTALVPSTSPYADLVRTLEVQDQHYDPTVLQPYESQSFFMMVLDYKAKQVDGSESLALSHVYRLAVGNERYPGLTGIETLDDLIISSQTSLEQVMRYYGIRNIGNCLSVATNISVPGVRPSLEKPYGALGYKALFEICDAQGAEYIFSYLNHAARKSLSRVGVVFGPLCGREDFLVPKGDPREGVFDDTYQPAAIPVQANAEVFRHYDPSKGPLARLIAASQVTIVEIPPNSVFGF